MVELILCTILWGASFLAQKLGADHFGPFTINCYRNVLAGAFLWLVTCRRGRLGRAELVGGSISGVLLFGAMLAQQIGIESTTPGVSAFLTANYVLLVPVFGVVLGHRAGWGVWGSVALALVGTWFICVGGAFGVGKGELWTLLCAAEFAVQIMVVEKFVHNADVLKFCRVQMFVAGFAALPFVFLPSEMARASWDGFVRGIPAVFFLGIFSSGIAYTLQCLGQAKVPAALASIIMSLESVFAALFGWFFLGDAMTPRQILGCALVLSAVIVSQLFASRKPKA